MTTAYDKVYFIHLFIYIHILYIYIWRPFLRGSPSQRVAPDIIVHDSFLDSTTKRIFFSVQVYYSFSPKPSKTVFIFPRLSSPFSNVCMLSPPFFPFISYNPCTQSHLPFCLGDVPINQMPVGVHTTGVWKLATEIHYDSLWYLGPEVHLTEILARKTSHPFSAKYIFWVVTFH